LTPRRPCEVSVGFTYRAWASQLALMIAPQEADIASDAAVGSEIAYF